MEWVYLSPHLDDVALSVGGLLWEQAQRGDAVQVWTICAGDPPPGPFSPFAEGLHARWGTGRSAVAVRREEDIASCERMGAAYRHFSVPDCIYRRDEEGDWYYLQVMDIFGKLHPGEEALVTHLTQILARQLPPDARLVVPLALGGHVDHRLVRTAAERLSMERRYYADYPYVLWQTDFSPDPLVPEVFPLSREAVQAWEEAVAAHRSQISTFWDNLDEMSAAIRAYAAQTGGVALYQMPPAER